MMAGSSLLRINGLGEFCMPVDGCRGRCAKHKPCRIADRYGCRWKLLTGWSFALYVSFSFLLLHRFCCIRTYGLHCPRPCVSFRGYSPPVAMNVVVFQWETTASSAGLCIASLELHICVCLPAARRRRQLWASLSLPFWPHGQPSGAAAVVVYIQDLAGWLAWGPPH